MNVATMSPTSTPTMLEHTIALPRRAASWLSRYDMSVRHTQRRFPPSDTETQLWLIAYECAESFLVFD